MTKNTSLPQQWQFGRRRLRGDGSGFERQTDCARAVAEIDGVLAEGGDDKDKPFPNSGRNERK